MFGLRTRELKVGDEVAVIPAHPLSKVRYQTVERVNPRMITLDDGTRWRARDGQPWGQGEWARNSPFLATPEDGYQRELDTREERDHHRAVRRFREAVSRFERERGQLSSGQVDQVAAAIEEALGHE